MSIHFLKKTKTYSESKDLSRQRSKSDNKRSRIIKVYISVTEQQQKTQFTQFFHE